jgi:tetratricopeptide (TPR) repeat protein
MKKIVVAMMLVAAVTAVAQTSTPAAPQQAPAAAPAQAAPAQPAPPPQKKEIKDPAEYNAYMGAANQTDPAAQISGFEAYLAQYPNSTFKEEALELLMSAYQKAGNAAKMLETAQKLLQANPCNIRALALVAYTKQAMATAGQNAAQNFAEAGQAGEKGLQCLQTAPKPDGTPVADWDKLKAQTTAIFNGAAGLGGYQAKDYAKAQQYLRAAVEQDPTNLLNVYDLALAYLAPGATEKDVDGLFFIARASNLAQGAGKAQIAKFGASKYNKYHGSEEGWSDLLAQTATTTLPAAGFTIKQYVPPTPAEQAAALVKSKKIEEMSFAEWQLVLSEGTPEDVDKVWSVLKGKPLQMQAHIISIDTSDKTHTKLMLAGSEDDIEAKRADIDLTMSATIPAKQMPKEDTDFQFQGTPASYVAKPFVMTMTDGALLVKAAPKPPIHHKPAAH